ncbi:MAG: pilus assembly PilX family protein [Burkholderiaceae bacterium]
MKISAQSIHSPTTRKIARHAQLPQSQRGVVLIIALILLVVISLLAVTSVRNASSTASISGNVRTTGLATQAAEIALLHCERSVIKILTIANGHADSYATTFVTANILLTDAVADDPKWQNVADNWDSASTTVFVLPLSLVNQTGTSMTATYKRAPECMVEHMPVGTQTAPAVPAVPAVSAVPAGPRNIPPAVRAVRAVRAVPATYSTVEDTDSSYLITARGFGPEVEADADTTRTRPVGSEVWLQSQIKIGLK